TRVSRQNLLPSATAAEARSIPFDQAFRYELTGRPGTVLSSNVTISIESSFTADSIGYGVVPKVQPIIFGPSPPPPVILEAVPGADSSSDLQSIKLGDILAALKAHLSETSTTLRGETGPEAVLRNGIKLNPDVAEFALQGLGSAGTLNKDVLG